MELFVGMEREGIGRVVSSHWLWGCLAWIIIGLDIYAFFRMKKNLGGVRNTNVERYFQAFQRICRFDAVVNYYFNES